MNWAHVPWHGKMIYELLEWHRRRGRPAYLECMIKLGKSRPTCDIGLFRREPPLRAATHDPTAFAVVVEVVSEESRVRDQVDKAREYAEAGIPEYWIVDEHPSDEADGMVSVFRLEPTDGGPRYLLRERVGGQELTSQGG